jgi:hypothetical protein
MVAKGCRPRLGAGASRAHARSKKEILILVGKKQREKGHGGRQMKKELK